MVVTGIWPVTGVPGSASRSRTLSQRANQSRRRKPAVKAAIHHEQFRAANASERPMAYGQACAPPKAMNAGGFSTERSRDDAARQGEFAGTSASPHEPNFCNSGLLTTARGLAGAITYLIGSEASLVENLDRHVVTRSEIRSNRVKVLGLADKIETPQGLKDMLGAGAEHGNPVADVYPDAVVQQSLADDARQR